MKHTLYFLLAFLGGVLARSFFDVPQNWIMLGVGVAGGLLLASAAASAISLTPLRNKSELNSATARPHLEIASAAPEAAVGDRIGITHPPTPSPSEGEGEGKRRFFFFQGVRSFVVPFLLLSFFLGTLRFSVFENNIVKDELHSHYGEAVTLRGSVLTSELKPNSSRLILETDLGRILIVSRIYPQFKYGEKLEVRGKILEPENYANFDTKKYLAKDRIYSQMLFPEIKKISWEMKPESDEERITHPPTPSLEGRGKGEGFFSLVTNRILNSLFLVKENFEQNLKLILPEPHASLADGMLLGEEGVLPKNLLDSFRKTSTIHILVLSGYNITIVGTFLLAFLSYILPAVLAWAFSILGIILFTLMTGAEPAAVRASIMAIIGLFALRTGKLRAPILALLFAAALMILWNPMYLRFDRGFQLSFMATLGLILLTERFGKFFRFLPKFWGIRESASASFSAQLFVLPLLISWGNQVLFLSPLVNILVVEAVPFIMFFSFLGSMVVFISYYLGAVLAAVSYVLISYQIYVVEFFAKLNI